MKKTAPLLVLAGFLGGGFANAAEPSFTQQAPAPQEPDTPRRQSMPFLVESRRRVIVDTAPDMSSRQRRRTEKYGIVHTVEI